MMMGMDPRISMTENRMRETERICLKSTMPQR
jgi:hypothetical protein